MEPSSITKYCVAAFLVIVCLLQIVQLAAVFYHRELGFAIVVDVEGSNQPERKYNIPGSPNKIKQDDEFENRLSVLETEVFHLKTENHDQNIKIERLERIIADLHDGKLSPIIENHTSGSMTPYKRSKRQLQTTQGVPVCNSKRCAFDFKENSKAPVEVNSSPVNKFPENCQDLGILGHKINGFYIVRKMGGIKEQFENVFCQFTREKTQGLIEFDNPVILETRYGYLDLKSSPGGVYFFVQRKTKYDMRDNTIVPFEIERLNIGNGMDYKSGVFTAPKDGVYYFSFMGVKNYDYVSLDLFLRRNGERIAKAAASGDRTVLTVSLQAIVKLKVNDKIDLFKLQGIITGEDISPTQFVGWLLEEGNGIN